MSATRPVEGPGTDVSQQNATQPVEAPSAGTATQPVEAPVAGPEVLLSGTGSDVQSDREEICKVSLVPLLVTTCGTAPQTKMFLVTKNSLWKLVTERPSEG